MSDTHFSLPRLSAEEALRNARGFTFLDMRKPEAARRSGKAVKGALRQDPYSFDHDHPLTRSDRPVAVFCVHGHEVSRFGCALLMLHGVDAQFVEGGFEALVAAGAPLEDLS